MITKWDYGTLLSYRNDLIGMLLICCSVIGLVLIFDANVIFINFYQNIENSWISLFLLFYSFLHLFFVFILKFLKCFQLFLYILRKKSHEEFQHHSSIFRDECKISQWSDNVDCLCWEECHWINKKQHPSPDW